MAKAKKSKAKKAKAKKSKAKKSKAKSKTKKSVKRAAAASSRKAKKSKAKRAAPKKAAKKSKAVKKAAPKKQAMGEGDYQASRKFQKDEAKFVKRHSAEIPQMGKAAEVAMDGPQGAELRAAEEEARNRSGAPGNGA